MKVDYPEPAGTLLRVAALAFAEFALSPVEAAAQRSLVAAALMEEAAFLFAEAGLPDRAAESIAAARIAEILSIQSGIRGPSRNH